MCAMRSILGAALLLKAVWSFRVQPKRRIKDNSTAASLSKEGAGVSGETLAVGKVVTIGDSFSSGTGIHDEGHEYDEEYGGAILDGWKFTPNSNGECWREKHLTPGPMYANDNHMSSIFLACKGAEVPQIMNQLDFLKSAYPTEAYQKWNGSVFVLTAGGNDIRTERGAWSDVLINCHWPFGDCDDNSENQVNNWAEMRSKLIDLYSQLAVEASGAKIRVLGYPRLMQRKGGSCWILPTLVKSELDWIDAMSDEFNAVMAGAMSTVTSSYPEVDIQYVNVTNYLTMGACESADQRDVNDEVIEGHNASISDASFHPTQKGYRRYYEALSDSLRR